MSATLVIAQARAQRALAEERAKKLQAELNLAQRELEEWELVIAKIGTLPIDEAPARDIHASEDTVSVARTAPESQPAPIEPEADSLAGKPCPVKVKRDSLAGRSVQLILERGPMTLKDLVGILKVREELTGDRPDAVLNSALWRRKDLFERRRKEYHLKTTEVEFVD